MDPNSKKIFFYQLYMQPSDLKSGVESYHSKFELIKTEKIMKEFVHNIQFKIQVVSKVEEYV